VISTSSTGRVASGDYENYKQEEDDIVKYSNYRGSSSCSSNSSGTSSHSEVALEDENDDAISRVTSIKQEIVKTTKKSYGGGAQMSAKVSSFGLHSRRLGSDQK
jgi:hypothetical protein